MSECRVLSGAFALFVQGILFLVSIAVLWFKFRVDPAGRTATQFVFDSSKQIFGAGWIHVLNLLFSVILESSTKAGDQCEWYWIEIMVDTTLGVAVEYVILLGIVRLLAEYVSAETAHEATSGKYTEGEFTMWGSYLRQLAVWLATVTGMKLVMLILFILLQVQMQAVAATILSPVKDLPNVKLIVVMILTPGIMNAVQFWLVDNIFVHTKDVGIAEARGAELPQRTVDAYSAMS
eukprot:TRINITY_DN13017_c1_g3_i2.p1 TRINITY_DN13017_c1_g3~~TRINITY_DN13017_c1_g3_i2.p1  ORF type:complete len:254 (-),score=33.66 TRINITY_DN13017_c1_g3_i2:759-1463(-)